MASTLTNLLYHLVFSTKGRLPLIGDEIQKPLYDYMGGIIRNQGGKTIEIGGMPDHVHCLARLPARKAVSDILRALKSDSSGWVNRERPGDRFSWQTAVMTARAARSARWTARRNARRAKRDGRYSLVTPIASWRVTTSGQGGREAVTR